MSSILYHFCNIFLPCLIAYYVAVSLISRRNAGRLYRGVSTISFWGGNWKWTWGSLLAVSIGVRGLAPTNPGWVQCASFALVMLACVPALTRWVTATPPRSATPPAQ